MQGSAATPAGIGGRAATTPRADGFRRRSRSFLRVLLLLAVAGLALRLVHIRQFFYTPIVDMETYMAYGELYMQGYLIPREPGLSTDLIYLTTRNPPGYPILVGLFRLLFGWESFRPVLYLQAVLDSLTIILLGLAGRFLYGARAGLLAALGFAIYRIAILFSGQLMTESVTMFLCASAVCAFLWTLERPRWWRGLLTGLLLAATSYFRLNVLMSLFAAFGLFALAEGWSRWRTGSPAGVRRLALAATLAIVTAVGLLAPWSVRNSIILQQFVPLSSSNAIRFLSGANPASRAEFVPFNRWPKEWQERLGPETVPNKDMEMRKQRDRVAEQIANEFMGKTHTAYFLFNVVPRRMVAFIWNEHWMFAGQGEGGPSEYPLGPRLRFPFLESFIIVTLGFAGFFIRGRRHRGFAPFLWLMLFLPLVYLPVDPRYRYISEMPLLLAAAALVDRAVLARSFRRRFATLVGGLVGIGALQTAGALVLFGGPNILGDPALLGEQPILKQAVEGTYSYSKPTGSKPDSVTLVAGRVPVDPGRSGHLAVEFDFRLLKPEQLKAQYGAWAGAWPTLRLACTFFDDDGTTLGTRTLPHTDLELSNYQSEGGSCWRLVEIPGMASQMQMALLIGRAGTVEVSNLRVRGALWLRPGPSPTPKAPATGDGK